MQLHHWLIVAGFVALCVYAFVAWLRRKPLTPAEKAEQKKIDDDLAQW